MAAVRIEPKGFAMFLPAIGGAEPWTGSNIDVFPGWILPLAAIPSPPCRPAARSVMMSPNMLLVTMTSNWRGSRTICMQSASTYMCCAMICGYSPLTSLNTRCHRPPAWVMAFDLSHIRTFLRGVADDALDAFARVDVFLGGDFIGRTLLEDAAGVSVNAFRIFAEHYEVYVLGLDSFQWTECCVEQADWAHVGIEIHFEAHAEQNFFGVNV